MQYPKMLYRHGGPEKIEGEHFTTLVVDDEDGEFRATEDGFRTTTTEALAERKAVSDETAVRVTNVTNVAGEVDRLKADLEAGLKKLAAEQEALDKERAELDEARAKVDADLAAAAEAIEQIGRDREALDAERAALKEGREALDADRKAFEAEKAAGAGKKK